MNTVTRTGFGTLLLIAAVAGSLYTMGHAGRDPVRNADGKVIDPTKPSYQRQLARETAKAAGTMSMEDMMRAKKEMAPKKPYLGPQNIPNENTINSVGGDDVGTATVIGGLPFTDVAATTGFNDDYDEVCPYGPHTSPDVVYSFTPGANYVVDLGLCNPGTDYDTKMFVYENAVTPGAPYACNDDVGLFGPFCSEILNLVLTGGNTYYIVIDGYAGDFGNYELTVTGAPLPTCQGNDDVGTAIAIGALPYTDNGSTGGCNNDYDEVCPFSFSPTSPDVVYSYSPAVTEAISIDLCNSAYDTKVYIYENAVTAGSPYACNDDGASCAQFQSQLDCVTIYAGNTYYIVVDGYGGDFGDYEITVTSCGSACQGNDDIASAEVIPALPYVDLGTTIVCDNDYDEVCPYGPHTSPDVVYAYTPAANEIIKLSLCNSGYDTKMFIYENAATPGSPFACDDDGCGAAAGYTSFIDCLPVTGGNTYYIVIDGYNGESGNYELVVEECQCDNDDAASATVIASLPFTGFGNTEDCNNNYDEVCPFSGSTSPDAVFSYTPSADQVINLSLCNPGTDYDTKLYIYEGSVTPGSPHACDDDACGFAGGYASQLDCVPVSGGTEYIIVVDGYAGDFGNFELTVSADETAPVVTCPAPLVVPSFQDLPLCGSVMPNVVEDCGYSVSCSRSSVGGVGCTGDPIPVEYTFVVTDDAGNSASCSWTVTVAAPGCPTLPLSVGNPGGAIDVPVGSQVVVPVNLTSADYPVGQFDLSLEFDHSAVSLLGVDRGDAIGAWEYFNYEITRGAATSVLRLVGIAQTSASNVPDEAFLLAGAVANLRLAGTSDVNSIGREIAVTWRSNNWTDNVVTGKWNDLVFVGNADAQACASANPDKIVLPTLQKSTSSLRIAPISAVAGDINLNGSINEIGDAVLLAGYLTYGEGALSPDPAQRGLQLAAADINGDGYQATVGDLVYLVRIIAGHASPLGTTKLSPSAGEATVDVQITHDAINLSTISSADLGGALFVFRHDGLSFGEPILADDAGGMTVSYSASNGALRLLVYSNDASASIPAGRRNLVTIPVSGFGGAELVESQISDAQGMLLDSRSAKSVVPTGFALLQNYPNPFNAGTMMAFDIVGREDWTLTVYNITGQTIREFSGRDASGHVTVAWDGRDNAGRSVASGMYFYRLQAGQFTASKKMTLVK